MSKPAAHFIAEVHYPAGNEDFHIYNYQGEQYPEVLALPNGYLVHRIGGREKSGHVPRVLYSQVSVIRLDDQGDRTCEAYEIDMPSVFQRAGVIK